LYNSLDSIKKRGESKMAANIANFTTPTGAHGNLFKPSTWLPLIVGAFVFLFTFTAAQKLGSAVHSKLPVVNTDPYSPFQSRPTAAPASTKEYIG
jgi:hypothetical protein